MIKRQPSAPTVLTVMVTKELHRHHAIEDVAVVHFGDGRKIKRHRVVTLKNKTQNPIDQYHYQGIITEAQYLAAERFYADWWGAGLPPRVTANLLRVAGGTGHIETDRCMQARDRHLAALRSLDAADHGFVINVVCYGQFLGGALIKSRKVVRIRLGRLREALNRLARHYGISA